MNLRETFYSRGYTDPQSVVNKSDVNFFKNNLEGIIKRIDLEKLEERNERHLDVELVLGICLDSGVVDSAKQILGESILLYSSTIFIKYPGDAAFPWHQDANFLHINPINCVTVWLAIDSCFGGNGALRFLDCSHKNEVPHLDRKNQRSSFQAYADPKKFHVNDPKLIDMESGEFVVFHPLLMHSSGTNLSLKRRAGLSIRFTTPDVKINHNAFFEGHRALPVK